MTLALGVVFTLAASSYLLFTDTLRVAPRLIALAVGMVAIAGLGRVLGPIYQSKFVDGWPDWHRSFKRGLPYAVTSFVVGWAFFPAPFELPINQDHGHHFLATKVFVDELLSSGHLFGWTDTIAGGLPFGDVYATPVYMLTSALHVMSLGLISLEFSYAVGVVFAWLLAGFVAVALTREVLGPSGSAATFGPTIAALAVVLDPGGDREGGWVYALFHAVWPQFFATALMALGVLLLIRYVRAPSWRRMAAASWVFGVAIWAHPMVALNLAWVAPIVFVVVLLSAFATRSTDTASLSALPWLIPLFATSAVLGMGFFVRMLTASDEIASFSAHGDELLSFGQHLLLGSPFANQLPLVTALGILGAAAAVVRRDLAGTIMLALTSVFVLLGSMELVLSYDLGSSDWLPMLMYRRFFISAKPFWFVLVGVGASTAWIGVKAMVRSVDAPLGVGTSWVFATPLVWAAIVGSSVLLPAPVGGVLGYDTSGVGKDIDALAVLLETERTAQNLDETVVVDWRERGDGSHYRLFAYAQSNSRYLATKAPPCQALGTVMVSRKLKGLEWLGATHLVSEHKKKFGGAKLVGSAGRFHLYRLSKSPPARPVKMRGPGTAVAESWSSMHREITIEGAKEKSTLVVGQPPYGKWTATQDGQTLSIDSRKEAGTTVIQIGGVKDGKVVLDYADTTLENVLFVLAWLTEAGLLLILVFGGPLWGPLKKFSLGPVPAIQGKLQPVVLYGATAATALAFIAALVGLNFAGASSAESFWQEGEPEGTQVLAQLHTEEPERFTYEPSPYCVRTFSRNPRVKCIESSLQPRLAAAAPRKEHIMACMLFGVPDKGKTSLTFDLPPGTTHVKGQTSIGKKSLKPTLMVGKKKHALKKGAFKHETQDLAKVHVVVTNTGGTANVCLELVALSIEDD